MFSFFSPCINGYKIRLLEIEKTPEGSLQNDSCKEIDQCG